MMRTWFITGTSSGLGLEMTKILLERGDHVIATLRKQGVLDDLAAKYPAQLSIHQLDVTDTAAIRRVVDAAFAERPIDVVVNNAGYGLFGATEELGDDQIIDQINTNIIGSIQVIRAALPHLRRQQSGRIMQVSSEGGQIAYPNFSLYHTTKWGIEGFIESLRQEIAGFGIDCTIIEPGPTETGFGAGLVSPPLMDAYDGTPAHNVREAIANGDFVIKGDAIRTAQAMVASVDVTPAPRRVTLGSTAYQSIHAALQERLSELEAQKDIAYSADRDI
ncbi:SDR family oxidoreductase [Thalassospira marina]|uniref:Short-chain dehydrogenase/reductase n=1 Tax=Thalassospira marina TaxID=2048283 RepID=A0A2N3KJ34_9PROT|nr:SDR family oxidoreductase [Thalassospira marina]PKR50555.1 short-chain dehydrogenase/reductase [Thalassospira marina]